MKQTLFLFILAICLGFKSYSQIWSNMQNTELKFQIKNAGITVDGKFTNIEAKVSVDEKDISNSQFTGVVQASSVSTGNGTRDNHLKNKSEFFDVTKFPTISMKALKVNAGNTQGSYKVDWLITMKGIIKKVTTDVLIHPTGNMMLVLTVFKINRRDWKVGSKSLLMSDEVVITLSGNLLK